MVITVIFISISCTEKPLEPKGSPEYISEIDQWHQKRVDRLKEENGWLTLVGLHWLEEGENTFGSDKNNSIVFPENAPKKIGTIILKDSVITLKVENSVNVLSNSNQVKNIKLKEDITGDPTILDVGTLRWYIIKRGERYGIRLRDTKHSLRDTFEGIERFPVNEDWKATATFDQYDPPKVISLPTQIGTIEEETSPGAVVFEKDGITYRIDAVDTGKRLWLIFADETSVNLAYNPPCVFTKYATCAFPPQQNFLELRITAGEKNWGKLH
jgi:uncharacterized protein (DUF1684 family)